MTNIDKIKFEQIKTSEVKALPPKKEEAKAEPVKDKYVSSVKEEKSVFGKAAEKVKNFINEDIKGAGTFKEKAEANLDFTTKAAIAGGVIGAGAGAAVGYQVGKAEMETAVKSHEVWKEPVMERKNLGYIPDDYYSPARWWWGDSWGNNHVRYDDQGKVTSGQSVIRDVPVYEADGTPKMKTVEGNISSQRYGVAGAALGLAAIGGIAGTAAGIAVGLINKLIHSK